MTTATLGFNIESSKALEAKKNLDQMSGASKAAEKAANALSAASSRAAGGNKSMAAASEMAASAQRKAATAINATTAAMNKQAASSKMVAFQSRMLKVQLGDVAQSLALGMAPWQVAIQQGPQIVGMYSGIGQALGAVSKVALRFGAILAPLAVGLAAVTHEANRGATQTVTMFQLLRGAFGELVDRLKTAVQPALDRFAGWWDRFAPRLVSNMADAANTVIGLFVGTYAEITAAWDGLPGYFGDLGIRTAQSFLDGMAKLARETLAIYNDLAYKITKKTGITIPAIDAGVYAPQLNNPYAGNQYVPGKAFMEGFNQDYVGGFAGDAVQRARELAAATEDVAGSAGKAKDAWKGLRKATEQASEAFKFARDTTKGFLSDLYSGLKSGEGFWKSFANAASNAIDKIVDKLLGNLVDALFQVNSAGQSIGGGGGGIFGAILGGIGSIFGFANGGYTGNGGRNQPAGIVHGGEYVFSKAATDRLGVRNLDSLHRRAKGYADGGYVPANNNQPAAANQPVSFSIQNTFDGDTIRTIIRDESGKVVADSAPAIVNAAVGQVNKNSAGMITSAQRRAL